jgi:PTH2 family peptidyl-tRNA hydrolase
MSPSEKEVAKAICEALGDDWNREGPEGLHEAYGPAATAAIRMSKALHPSELSASTREALKAARMDQRHEPLNALMDDIVGVQGDRDPSEPRLYLIVRGDIEMSIGKGMAQAGHAFVGVVEAARRAGHPGLEAYLAGQQGKIAMKAKNAHAIERAAQECRALGLPVCVVTDAGRTEFSEPTLTCMAVGPVSRSGLPRFVQRMQLNS